MGSRNGLPGEAVASAIPLSGVWLIPDLEPGREQGTAVDMSGHVREQELKMFEKGRKRGTVRFSIRAGDGMKKVFLTGDFTGWVPVPMRKRKGVFSATVPVPPGTHEYKLIVDGQWQNDPDNSNWVANPYGTLNTEMVVE